MNTAAALLTALPPLLIYFVSGRYFVRGITAGAVKGQDVRGQRYRTVQIVWPAAGAHGHRPARIEAGAFTVLLLGLSGCGKSTLLNSIAGLEDTDSGIIEIDGADVTHHEPSKRGIAMVFQSYALYPTMTVRKNMSFGLRVRSVPRQEVARRVDWAAKLLQINELLDRKPSQLSGGQRQRVAIGRALVQQAKVFLFDEPLSNLDAKLRTEMRKSSSSGRTRNSGRQSSM